MSEETQNTVVENVKTITPEYATREELIAEIKTCNEAIAKISAKMDSVLADCKKLIKEAKASCSSEVAAAKAEMAELAKAGKKTTLNFKSTED